MDLIDGRLTKEQIQTLLKSQFQKAEITDNMRYYAGENADIGLAYAKNAAKGVKPNHVLPSAYASTLTDTAAGFSFSDVIYKGQDDDEYVRSFNEFMYANDGNIKNYRLGQQQLGYGLSYAIHYVDKTPNGNNYRFEVINDPRTIIAVFGTRLNSILQCFLHITALKKGYYVEVYYNDIIEEWQIENVNRIKDFKLISDTRVNDYGMPPLEYYYNNFDPMVINSVFQKVKPYIAAVDAILTGTWNEIEKHAKAILVAMRKFKQGDMNNMKNKRVLSVSSKEESDATKFLTKEVQFEYIEWYYKALVQEIHKHTHILDYQNPEANLLGGESGKALKYRHIDMMNLANRIEMYNRKGQYQRIKLFNAITKKSKDYKNIDIVYKRTLPDDLEERVEAVNKAVFLSNYTKAEQAGFDPEEEAKRLNQERSVMADSIQNLGGENE